MTLAASSPVRIAASSGQRWHGEHGSHEDGLEEVEVLGRASRARSVRRPVRRRPPGRRRAGSPPARRLKKSHRAEDVIHGLVTQTITSAGPRAPSSSDQRDDSRPTVRGRRPCGPPSSRRRAPDTWRTLLRIHRPGCRRPGSRGPCPGLPRELATMRVPTRPGRSTPAPTTRGRTMRVRPRPHRSRRVLTMPGRPSHRRSRRVRTMREPATRSIAPGALRTMRGPATRRRSRLRADHARAPMRGPATPRRDHARAAPGPSLELLRIKARPLAHDGHRPGACCPDAGPRAERGPGPSQAHRSRRPAMPGRMPPTPRRRPRSAPTRRLKRRRLLAGHSRRRSGPLRPLPGGPGPLRLRRRCARQVGGLREERLDPVRGAASGWHRGPRPPRRRQRLPTSTSPSRACSRRRPDDWGFSLTAMLPGCGGGDQRNARCDEIGLVVGSHGASRS